MTETMPSGILASRVLRKNAAPPGHDRRARNKDAGSANSSAICATEDEWRTGQRVLEAVASFFQHSPSTDTTSKGWP